ncbi:MAG: class I SAM-dependent methyltransferase [Acidimicrobiia bacterium]|nr:class I SAM-dependent methyltransferase [Acidimicrobiia bacterium]
MTSDRLIEGIHEHRLADWAAEMVHDPATSVSDRLLAARAIETTRRIGERTSTERSRIVDVLGAAGIEVRSNDEDGPVQNHTISLVVADHAGADRAAGLLEADGYERWEVWTRGAAESFRRHVDRLTVGRTTDVTMVVRIAWSEVRTRTTLDRLFRPTAGDWDMIDLPSRAWPAYSVVRPTRLLLERIGRRDRYDAGLGPHLSTPESLIPPLLEFAGLRSSDRFVDVGCGDGRLAVAAAASYGCRVIGIERSAELVDAARARAERAAVGGLVDIRLADARSADMDSPTVIFMFLPVDVVSSLLAPTLERLPAGARLVIHEQGRLPSSIDPRPDESAPIIGEDAVTVAHRWVVGGA